MKNICQLQKLARMIAMKNTGSRCRLAKIFHVKERTISNWISYLEQLYSVKICFCRQSNSYVLADGEFPSYICE